MASILIVDDELGFRRQLELRFARQGYHVLTASNGEEAIAIGSKERPDVLVCDWMLQDHIHGLHVMEVLRAVAPNLQCILITGFASKTLKNKADEMQIFGFLNKPFDIDDLLGMVSNALVEPCKATQTTEVAVFETDEFGRILYKTPDASKLLLDADIAPDIEFIQDCFKADEAPRLETARQRWVELLPKSVEEGVWLIRSRGLPNCQRQLYLVLPENDRSVKIHSLVNMLLGLPSPSQVRLQIEGHVLLVDSNDIVRSMTQETLEHLECVCHAASDTTEAIELFRRDPQIEFLILDFDTPRDLPSFINDVREARPTTTFIGTSRNKFAKQKFTAMGVTRFIRKPYINYDLVYVLNDYDAS
jgi:DNA-binding NtrC family response regulator